MNVTSTEATTAAGYVTVGPKGALDTGTSSLNLQPGATVPNLVTVKVGTGGQVSLYTNVGAVHLIVDVFGYYAPDDGDAFTGIQPNRILDTRDPNNIPAGWPQQQPFVGGTAFGQMDLPVAGVGDVPGDARSVVLNITSTQASTANGYVTVGPTGNLNTGTSNLNLQPGYNVPEPRDRQSGYRWQGLSVHQRRLRAPDRRCRRLLRTVRGRSLLSAEPRPHPRLAVQRRRTPCSRRSARWARPRPRTFR